MSFTSKPYSMRAFLFVNPCGGGPICPLAIIRKELRLIIESLDIVIICNENDFWTNYDDKLVFAEFIQI